MYKQIEWKQIIDARYGERGFYLTDNFFMQKYNPHKKLYVITYMDDSDSISVRECLYHCTNSFDVIIKDLLQIKEEKRQHNYAIHGIKIHICDRQGFSQGRLLLYFQLDSGLLNIKFEIDEKYIKMHAKNKYYNKKAYQLLTDIILTLKLIA
jgi:hypothetical protein